MSESAGLLNLIEEARELSEPYENVVLSKLNDHVVRISLMTEPYFWHLHPNSDETFVGLEGTVILEFDEGVVELRPGQLFTVRKGVKHRTAPAGARSVNLTIERADMVTVRIDERSS